MTTKDTNTDGINPEEHISSVWDFADEDQKKQMLEPITQDNCGAKLKLVREVSGQSRKELANVIGVAESTIYRLEKGKKNGGTLPKAEFMLRLGGLVAIGHAKYSKMTENDKESLSEYIGAAGGVAAGVGGAIGAISVSGTVAGLSAAGITSGLAALGGSMLGGLAVVAIIPVAVGAAGYGLVKGIKLICKANKFAFTFKEVDKHWEIVPQKPDDAGGEK
jgi:DNA-binding XRE family transcriptional regulator